MLAIVLDAWVSCLDPPYIIYIIARII